MQILSNFVKLKYFCRKLNYYFSDYTRRLFFSLFISFRKVTILLFLLYWFLYVSSDLFLTKYNISFILYRITNNFKDKIKTHDSVLS